MKNICFIFLFLISLISINFISAIQVGNQGKEGVNFKYLSPINYSTINTNYSSQCGNSDTLDNFHSNKFCYSNGTNSSGQGCQSIPAININNTNINVLTINSTSQTINGNANVTGNITGSIGTYEGLISSTAVGLSNGGITAFGQGATASGFGANAFGSYYDAPGPPEYQGALASGISSISIGSGTETYGTVSIALGSGSIANNDYSLALGNGATTNGDFGVAIGQSTATGYKSVAIGNGVSATGETSLAIGSSLEASGGSSVCMGESSLASGYASFGLGSSVTAGPADYTTAMGWNFVNNVEKSFAVGYGQKDFSVQSGNTTVYGKLNITGSSYLPNNGKSYFGSSSQSSINYNGTDLLINPKEVGSGKVYIQGRVDAQNNFSVNGKQGLTISSNKTVLKDANLITLVKTYCDINETFTGGILTYYSTNC